MSWSYSLIEHTADLAVKVTADSLKDLFSGAAYAWKEAVIEDLTINKYEEKELSFDASSSEELLVGFLSELNLLLNIHKWIFTDIILIRIYNGKLSVRLQGSKLNEGYYSLKEEIKAVTYHQLEIQEEEGKLSTLIIFDI